MAKPVRNSGSGSSHVRKRRGSNGPPPPKGNGGGSDANKKFKGHHEDDAKDMESSEIVSQLLQELTPTADNSVNKSQQIRFMQRAVDQGWIRTVVGPEIEKQNDASNKSDQLDRLCRVWALLLSWEGQSGRLNSSTLSYLASSKSASTESLDVATVVLPKLFLFIGSSSGDDNQGASTHEWLATVCHCLTLLGSVDRQSPAKIWNLAVQEESGTSQDAGSALMKYVSPHVGELWKRQNPILFPGANAENNENENANATGQNSTTSPFLVLVLNQVLECLEDHTETDEEAEDVTTTQNDSESKQKTIFVHRALEWLVDLLSLSVDGTLRTFVLWYLKAIFFSLRAHRAMQRGDNQGNAAARHLTQQLLYRIQEWQNFPLQYNNKKNSQQLDSGENMRNNQVIIPRSQQETMHLYYRRASTLQKMCHRYHAHTLDDIIFAGLGRLCAGGKFVENSLASLSDSELLTLLHKLRLLDENEASSETLKALYHDRSFLLQILNDYLQQPKDALEELQYVPLFCTEKLLWDATKIPPNHSSLLLPSKVLSLPKLSSTHYLSFTDYLWRNFSLLQLETASAIRSDLVNVIRRLRPVMSMSNDNDDEDIDMDGDANNMKTTFAGWARMALELQPQQKGGGLTIVKVEKPLLGKTFPNKVLAECTIDLGPCGAAIRREWDALSEHDNIFFAAIHASPDNTTGQSEPPPTVQEYREQLGYDAVPAGTEGKGTNKDRLVPDDDDPSFPQRYGVQLVRGGTIVQIRDEEGTVLTDPIPSDNPHNFQQSRGAQSAVAKGTKRVIRVAVDPVQYAMDMKNTLNYGSMNVVVRRHGRENSFKALLETARSLLAGTDSVHRVLPVWLQSILLGQGPATAANYTYPEMREYSTKTVGVPDPSAFLDYGDTFLDESHLRKSIVDSVDTEDSALITIDGREEEESASQNRRNYKIRSTHDDGKLVVEAISYTRMEHHTKGNPIRFTPKQVEAVRSGLSCGLTMVVGPPGTGKTDVAVQIIASLYHSFPTQRTVIITHSNAALNDIFEKVMARGDIEERYLLRLGSGERDLQTDSTHDFTKIGRVQYCFDRRSELLELVQQLSESLGLSGRAERGHDGSPSYTCESAAILYAKTIQPKIQAYLRKTAADAATISGSDRARLFPFLSYFSIGTNAELSREESEKHLDRIRMLFNELAEYRPLELLRSQRQRTEYFLIKQAKVVAMTSTHAAIARANLISLGFQYDNLVVEEAGQMTELDTFIPLLLQKGEADDVSDARSRLKRVCLLGDHNQLPPVIKNMSFARYSNMDQGLFARLIRLGVPRIELDKQGRTRPEIAELYNWRYENLGNLDHVSTSDRFRLANPGFARTFQFINVDNFQEKGETTPTAFFYQNVGEAEYAVALFQYMVLIGYPAQSISILTTYNGQKELISDIVEQRCGEGTPLAGVRPGAISTVDQYQGQQNDYVLLSLVRTESIGHLRDIRRLVVAVSRARYGLYVLGRHNLFASHHELQKVFSRFENEADSAASSHKLQLLLNETFPSERQVDDELPMSSDGAATVFEVDDVEHLGAIVHQMQDIVNATEA